MTQMTQINLSSNHIGEEDCRAMVTTLLTNKTLIQINLRDNQITDKGCNALATRNTTLASSYLLLSLLRLS